jgi:hypothetical protein
MKYLFFFNGQLLLLCCVCCKIAIQDFMTQLHKTNKKHLRFHRRVHRRTITRRYFTKNWKKITGVCHIHRRSHRQPITRWYFTESSKKIMGVCHNHQRTRRRFYRRILPTKYRHPEAHVCQTRVCRADVPTDWKVWRDFKNFLVRISINYRRNYQWNLIPLTTINVRR